MSRRRRRAILDELKRLLGRRWTNAKSTTRPPGLQDVLIVAPYNDQVALLTDTLPDGARVGTVDTFQRQEAAVVFFSMATSSGEDVPRNLDFFFSRNRLNVAVSWAKCLAYVVASPRLPDEAGVRLGTVLPSGAVWSIADAEAVIPELPRRASSRSRTPAPRSAPSRGVGRAVGTRGDQRAVWKRSNRSARRSRSGRQTRREGSSIGRAWKPFSSSSIGPSSSSSSRGETRTS